MFPIITGSREKRLHSTNLVYVRLRQPIKQFKPVNVDIFYFGLSFTTCAYSIFLEKKKYIYNQLNLTYFINLFLNL